MSTREENNKKCIEDLHKSYKDNNLEVLVGAGTSIASGFPNWEQLIHEIIKGYFRKEHTVNLEPEEIQKLANNFTDHFGMAGVVDLIRKKLDSTHEKKQTDAGVEYFMNTLAEGINVVVDFFCKEINSFHKKEGTCVSTNPFIELVREALYKNTNEKVMLQPIHYELGALIKEDISKTPHGLYTLNFDYLLQNALKKFEKKKVKTICPNDTTDLKSVHFVSHIHGLCTKGVNPIVEYELNEFGQAEKHVPVPKQSDDLVLSEHDFLDPEKCKWPDSQLTNILKSSDLLLIGLSIADPRLRRLLYDRKNDEGDEKKNVFAIMTVAQLDKISDPVERRITRLQQEEALNFWEIWDVRVIQVESYDLIPLYLRQIRLGTDPRKWHEIAHKFLNVNEETIKEIYIIQTENEQKKSTQLGASFTLERTISFIRDKFEVATDEKLSIGCYAPANTETPEIQLYYQFKEGFVIDDDKITQLVSIGDDNGKTKTDDNGRTQEMTIQFVSIEKGETRRLRVGKLEEAQGVAGQAFLKGVRIEETYKSKTYTHNFPEEKEFWRNETFSSLMCIPVHDTKDWIPVGVVYITSIRKEPFWTFLDPDESYKLEAFCRSLFRELFGYESYIKSGDIEL